MRRATAVENVRPAFPAKVEFPENSGLAGQRGACGRYRRRLRFFFGSGSHLISHPFISKQQDTGNKAEGSDGDAYCPAQMPHATGSKDNSNQQRCRRHSHIACASFFSRLGPVAAQLSAGQLNLTLRPFRVRIPLIL